MNNFFSRGVQPRVKGMEQTVNHAETYLDRFCSLLASYTRKTAKLRDKADLLVAQLFAFSSTEDPEFQTGFKNLAEDLAMVQDFRQAQVERLDVRVVSPLKAYGDIIKNKRADLKTFNADRNREMKELRKLEKVRLRNPADRQSISQAEVNAQKASDNAQRSTRQLEETISDFQRQKLEDLKSIFTDFITVEMHFHAKALEVYAHTLQNLETIDVHKDLEMFRGRIRMSDPLSGPLDTPLTSRSVSPMSATAIPSTSQGFRSTPASRRGRRDRTPAPARRHCADTLRRQEGIEEEEDEVEDEEEDEEEEEEEEDEVEMNESEIEEVQHANRQSYASNYVQMRRQHK